MSYLYGDSTPSPLESNFIQFLGEALDFSVHILQGATRIQLLGKRMVSAQEAADAEITRLEALRVSVAAAAERTPKGTADSPTSTCAKAILASVTELVDRCAAQVAATLATDVAALKAQEAQERQASERALEGLARLHDPPGTVATVRLVQQGAHYAATRTVKTPFGLDYAMELETAAPHPFSQVARVDKFVPHLEIQAPEAGGWLRKEIKNRPQRLEKYYLTEMRFAPGSATLRLRASVDDGAHGFDVEINEQAPRVQMVHVGDAGEAPGPFEISEADAAKVLALHERLRAAAMEVVQSRTRLVEAQLDQHAFRELPDTAILVDRLVKAMAPVVQEIAEHSLAPGELILKKMVGDHRREEIFVSKASLDEKLAGLPEAQRSKFRALGLSASFSRQPPPPPESRPKALAPTPEPATAEPSVIVEEDEEATAAFILNNRSSVRPP
ncbi:MAG: hypothetical protein ACLQVI_17850 [Polyangiaceae bacterium]|jgi:hypothetical protein